MNTSITNNEFTLFKEYIKENCGIEIDESKSYLIETRLSKILADSGLNSFGELYIEMMAKTGEYEEQIIDAITTNETLWFRDKTPWEIIESLMPTYVEALQSGKKSKIRIWSAAASTGQEAYSTAICIADYLKRNNILSVTLKNFEIIATDISKSALKIGKNGRYDAISIMRGLNEDIKHKYFENEGRIWEIKDFIKEAVIFKKFNLQNSFFLLGKFDIIFCRYVMIYFCEEFKEELAQRLKDALLDDGILFLGAYELYREIKHHFTSQTKSNGAYYCKII